MESTNTPAIKATADHRYTKKPVTIEAVQFDGTLVSLQGFALAYVTQDLGSKTCQIPTLEGEMTAQPGDWIIRGVKGEFYPCKPDVFAMCYEPAATPAIQAVAPIPAWREQLFAIAPEYEGKGLIDIPMSAQVVGLNAEVKALRAALGHSAAVPAQQTTNHDCGNPGCTDCFDAGEVASILALHKYLAPAAPVAPDLASLTRWEFGFEALRQDKFGDYVLLADVERLLSHPAQAPVDPMSALTDEQTANKVIAIGRQFHSWGMGYVQDQTGAWTIPRLPKCLQDFSRALLAASPKVEPVSGDTEISYADLELMYAEQCKCTDEWADKYRAEVERKADATLQARVTELESSLAQVNARLAHVQSGSLLREPLSAANPLPPGCHCKPGKCAAPQPNWCRDAAKRDATPSPTKEST